MVLRAVQHGGSPLPALRSRSPSPDNFKSAMDFPTETSAERRAWLLALLVLWLLSHVILQKASHVRFYALETVADASLALVRIRPHGTSAIKNVPRLLLIPLRVWPAR